MSERNHARVAVGPQFRHYCGDLWTIRWAGAIYDDVRPVGEPTVAAIAQRLAEAGSGAIELAELAQSLHGIYGIVATHRVTGEVLAMVDNSGLYALYLDGASITSDFLALVARKPDGLDDRALVEFIGHGGVFGPSTILRGVNRVDADEVICIGGPVKGRSTVQRYRKRYPVLDVVPPAAVDTEWRNLMVSTAQALADSVVAVDATGGLDTRLLIGSLDSLLPHFSLGVAGPTTSLDVELARRVATVVTRPIEVVAHRVEDLDRELAEVFGVGDGQSDVLRFHRPHQLGVARRDHGVDVMIHGGGGELYRDFLWLQDAPLIGMRRPDYHRYHSLRLAPLDPRPLLHPRAALMWAETVAATLESFEAMNESRNTEGYLRVHHRFRAPEFYGRTATNYVNTGLGIAMPYLDRQLVDLVIASPLRHRMINGWHRRMISGADPRLADITTTEGYRPRDGIQFLAEAPSYLAVQGRRLLRKRAQRRLGTSPYLELGAAANNTTSLYEQARRSELVIDAVNSVREHDLIDPSLQLSEIGDLHLGRITTVGLLLRHRQRAGAHSTLREEAT